MRAEPGDRAGREEPPGPPDAAAEEELARIVAEWSDRLNAGERLDVEALCEAHPALAPGLGEALRALLDLDAAADRRPPPAASFAGFEIEREIGRGGMGVVYEARDLSLDRRVALKVLSPGAVPDPRAVARFELEARVAARLQHPGIVSVHGRGVEGGAPFIVMELVEGETLAARLARLRHEEGAGNAEGSGGKGRLPAPPDLFRLERDPGGDPLDRMAAGAAGAPERSAGVAAAEAFAAVADALQYAHAQGVIHRDLKPSNLILDRAGRLRILDLGLAHLEGQDGGTRTGEFLGTPAYMSPEQARARKETPLDHRTDIYSLGATLYEALAGRPPFRGRDHRDTLSQIVSREPTPLRRIRAKIPRSLETIVLHCLEKDPAARYLTAEALAQDLRRFARGDPIEARPPPRLARLARHAWARRRTVLTAASLLFSLLSAAVFLHLHRTAAEAERGLTYRNEVLRGAVRIEMGLPPGVWPDAAAGARPRAPERGVFLEAAFAEGIETADPGRERIEEALAALEAAALLLPARPDAHYHRARGLHLLGRDREALEELERALAADPRFVPALALRDSLLERMPVEKGRAGSTAAAPANAAGRGGGAAEPVLPALAAWREARRAEARREWAAAARAYGDLLQPGGPEPYVGSSLEARLGRGRALLQAGDLRGALEDFAAARALWPDLLEPDLLLGKTYHLLGNAAWAEALWEARLQASGASSEVALRIAEVYRGLREIEKGLRWAGRAAASPARERLRAHLLAAGKRLDEAREAAESALALEAPSPADRARSLAALASILHLEGKGAEATAEFRKAVELDGAFVAAWNGLGYSLEVAGTPAEALAAYDEAIRREPGYLLARINRGNLLYRQGKAAEALEEHRRAAEIDPGDAGALSNVAEDLRKLGKVEEALAEHRRAIALDPSRAASHHNLALAAKDAGDLEGAAAALREAVRLDPGSARRRNSLGRLLAGWMRDPRGAIEEYRAALALDPGYWPARYNLVLSLEETGPREEADAAARAALESLERSETSRADGEARSCRLHLLERISRSAAREGRAVEAREAAEKALALLAERAGREDASAKELNQFAMWLLEVDPAELRDPARALLLARRAVERDGGKDAEILDTLAEALFATGDREGAVREETRALRLLPAAPRDKRGRLLRGIVVRNLARFRGEQGEVGDAEGGGNGR